MKTIKMIVAVASLNTVKVDGIVAAFKSFFDTTDITVLPCSTISSVREQPLSSKETLTGAVNRLKDLQKKVPSADYYVSFESGVCPSEHFNLMTAINWACIENKKGQQGVGFLNSFILPKKVGNSVLNGESLHQAMCKNFPNYQSKGAVDYLTNNTFTRQEIVRITTLSALAMIKENNLYGNFDVFEKVENKKA